MKTIITVDEQLKTSTKIRLPEPLFRTTRQEAEEELRQLELLNYEAEIIPDGNIWVIV